MEFKLVQRIEDLNNRKTNPATPTVKLNPKSIICKTNPVASTVELDPESIIRKFITRELHRRICEAYDLHDEMKEDFCVFLNYFVYTYYFSEAQGKVLIGGKMRMFNTGLMLHDTDPIYMLLGTDKNNKPGLTLFTQSSRTGRMVTRLFGNRQPELADVPKMNFDSSLQTVQAIDHILGERFDRLPEEPLEMVRKSSKMPEDCRNLPVDEIVKMSKNYFRRLLTGCILDTQTRIRNRRDEAVQFWFKRTNKMCWLIPLRLGITDEVNLALVLEPSELNGNPVYMAHTILPLKEAFKCARLLGPVKADWLKDAWKSHTASNL